MIRIWRMMSASFVTYPLASPRTALFTCGNLFLTQGVIMQKMTNAVQHYAWGSHDALTKLYGIANPQGKPMAELWMGAHPKSSSQVTDAAGALRSLRDVIDENPQQQLGRQVAE